jgi:hypothetical protein
MHVTERATGARPGDRRRPRQRARLLQEDLQLMVQHQHLDTLAGGTGVARHDPAALEHLDGGGAEEHLDTTAGKTNGTD